MRDLSNHRLVLVAPQAGRTGVGDYADDLVPSLRRRFGEVVEVRHGSPGTSSARLVREHVRTVRELVATAPGGRVVVHAELSGGSVEGFWASRSVGAAVPVTATVHDPPRLVWFPTLTRLQGRHRLLTHGVNYPLNGVHARLERRVAADRTFFALSRTGAAALAAEYPAARVVPLAMLVPARPAITPVADRPRAVGLFGHVYHGKGFDLLDELRRRLPADVAVRVAGRGTREAIAPRPGVEVLGAVDGPDEDRFFASISALVVPYGPRAVHYGLPVPASGTLARAIAYRTPVVVSGHGALAEVAEDGGGLVAPDIAGIAAAAAALVGDPGRLTTLAAEADRLAHDRSPEACAAVLAATWESM